MQDAHIFFFVIQKYEGVENIDWKSILKVADSLTLPKLAKAFLIFIFVMLKRCKLKFHLQI